MDMSIINSINFIASLFYTNSSKKFIMNIWKSIRFDGVQTYVDMRFEYCFIKYLNEWSECVSVYVALETFNRFDRKYMD